MAAAEHEGARPVERIDERQCGGVGQARQQRQGHEECTEGREAGDPRSARHAHGERVRAGVRRVRTQPQQTHESRRHDDAHLGERAGQQEHRHERDHGDERPREVRGESPRHADDGVRDDPHRHRQETADPPRLLRPAQCGEPQRQYDEHDGRRQGECRPCGQQSQHPSALQSQRHPHLAGGGARQELTEGHEVRVGPLPQPLPADDEGFPEIPQVCDGAPEGGEPQPQEHPEDLADGAGCARYRCAVRRSGHPPHDRHVWPPRQPHPRERPANDQGPGRDGGAAARSARRRSSTAT